MLFRYTAIIQANDREGRIVNWDAIGAIGEILGAVTVVVTLFCAFASKSEPKTAYICIPNCPGYGGQVA